MKVVLTVIAIICIIIGLSEVLWPKTDFWIKCFDKSLTKYKKSAFIQAHSIASIIGGVLLIPLAFEMAPPRTLGYFGGFQSYRFLVVCKIKMQEIMANRKMWLDFLHQ